MKRLLITTILYLGLLATLDNLLANANQNTPKFSNPFIFNNFATPVDLEFVVNNNELSLIVADKTQCCIKQIHIINNETTTLLGNCNACGYTNTANPLEVSLNSPMAVVNTNSGLLVADTGNKRLILLQNQTITTVELTGIDWQPQIIDLSFSEVFHILFAADIASNRVLEINTTTWSCESAIGSGANGFDEFSTDATEAPMGKPVGVALLQLSSGELRLFVAEADLRMVRLLFYSDNRLLPVAGNPYCTTYKYESGIVGALFCFNRPFRIATLKGSTYVFITDPPAGLLYFYNLADGNVYVVNLNDLQQEERIISVATTATENGNFVAVGTNKGRILVYSIQ